MAIKSKKIEEEPEDNNDDAPAVDPQAAAKKKKLMLLAGIGVVLLLLAGGGTWLALSLLSDEPAAEEVAATDDKAAEHKDEHAAQETEKKTALYQTLDPAFLANYSVGGKQRYLQVSIAAMTRDEKASDALRQHMPLVRNRIVMLLSGETFEQLQTDEGRSQLQQKLLLAIQEILKKETGEPGIEQVFFTNLVMQ